METIPIDYNGKRAFLSLASNWYMGFIHGFEWLFVSLLQFLPHIHLRVHLYSSIE